MRPILMTSVSLHPRPSRRAGSYGPAPPNCPQDARHRGVAVHDRVTAFGLVFTPEYFT